VVENLLSPWWNAVLSLAGLWLGWHALSALYGWAVARAAFGTTPASCEGIEGACWSFVADTIGLFLVGIYPAEERWRPFLCFVILLALALLTGWRRARRRPWMLAGVWLVCACTLVVLLHGGGWTGLEAVPTGRWGGLLLTLILSINGIVFSFPIGILLALGRRSRSMPAVRALCVGYIELIRGVPLISILFLASVLVPLFLPERVEVDTLIRAQVGIIVFQAGYMAEVVRGGLQAIPKGQEEAAYSLGLSHGRTMLLVVLPQALRIVIPSLTNQFIIILKDTSLVSVVGLFDLLGSAEITVRNPKWLGMTFEAYAVVAFFYWILCFSISRVSLRLEQRLDKSRS
jgi:general L-amino acid transport system permease protein